MPKVLILYSALQCLDSFRIRTYSMAFRICILSTGTYLFRFRIHLLPLTYPSFNLGGPVLRLRIRFNKVAEYESSLDPDLQHWLQWLVSLRRGQKSRWHRPFTCFGSPSLKKKSSCLPNAVFRLGSGKGAYSLVGDCVQGRWSPYWPPSSISLALPCSGKQESLGIYFELANLIAIELEKNVKQMVVVFKLLAAVL